MTNTVDFIFDFSSPNAYFSHRVIPGIEARTGAAFNYIPCLLGRTQDPEVKAKLVANTEAAVARGAFGVPTFYVGAEMFFGKDRLQQVEEEINARG